MLRLFILIILSDQMLHMKKILIFSYLFLAFLLTQQAGAQSFYTQSPEAKNG